MTFNSEHIDDTFTNVECISHTLDNIYFQNCTFKGCHFTQAQIIDCTFEDCTFERCDLSLIDVTNSQFVEVVFKHCKCVGINWTKAGQRLVPRFEHCLMNASSFLERNIPELHMTHCNAHEVNFSGAKLHWANFSHTDFEKSIFNHTDVTDANFEHATHYAIDVKHNTIKGATFSLPEAIELLTGLNIKLV